MTPEHRLHIMNIAFRSVGFLFEEKHLELIVSIQDVVNIKNENTRLSDISDVVKRIDTKYHTPFTISNE